ncbi:MAG TPA: hypothetical protein VGS22_29015 [Thermoanaerobaculia bacterium]|jgi:hypothetical protein|nr:hypothetical protein [Thermoanaerobaculia bacterium]
MKRNLAHLFLLLLLPSAVAADWLAFKDGTTTETKGPWKIQGRRIVFTSMSGTLTAARLDEIDLPASEQLSKNAASDRKLIEIKSSPTVIPWWQHYSTDDPVLLSAGGEQFIAGRTYDYWYRYPYYPNSHIGESCVPSRVVGISSGVNWWLQTGTKVAKFRLIGLQWADVERLKALMPDGQVCYEVDARIPSPDPAGNIVGYAHLQDGRDVGLELVRARAARLNDEVFSHRKDYLAAMQ